MKLIIKILQYCQRKYIPFYLFCLFIVICSIFLVGRPKMTSILIFCFWILIIVIYKLNYSMTLLIGILLLLCVPALLVFNQSLLLQYADVYASWVYLFFFITTAQIALDSLLQKSYNVSYARFLKDLWYSLQRGIFL